MNAEILFCEKQRFSPVLGGLIFIISLLPLVLAYYSGSFGSAGWKSSMNKAGIIIPTVIILAASALLFISQLETKISTEGIAVKFFPYHSKEKFFKWTEISSAAVRKYNPIGEYGGWGLKGFWGDKAYNASGDLGLQLVFKDGKKLLIGTNEPVEMNKVLEKLNLKK